MQFFTDNQVVGLNVGLDDTKPTLGNLFRVPFTDNMGRESHRRFGVLSHQHVCMDIEGVPFNFARVMAYSDFIR